MIDASRYSAPIVRVYEEIVDTLLTDLAKRFNVKATGNTGTFAYDVELLARLGEVRKETANTIAGRVAQNEPMVRLAIEQAMLDALEGVEPSLAEAARKGLLKDANVPMRDGIAAQLDAYSRQAVQQLNLVNTVMLDGTLKAYKNGVYHLTDIVRKLEGAQNVLNAETGKVILGASTRQEAVRSAVKRMAQAGITGFVDHGGHKWSPEAYVSMDIKTTCSNAANQAVLTRNGQYGNDLIWVRTNATARPGCAPWQGKVIAMSGGGRWVTNGDGRKIYAYAVGETTYHEPAGIFGINCHHGPPNVFIPGLSYVRGEGTADPEANAERYAETQRQRRLEREVRYAKREAAMLEAAGDPEGFEEAALRVKRRQQVLKTFAAEHELPLSSDRTFVFGYNRSVSGKAAAAARRAESRANYLQNIKPTLQKVAKANDAVLQSMIEVSSSVVNGVIPRGATMERVRVIAGYHTSIHLKDVKRLCAEYGGADYLWDKMAGTVSTDTFLHEIHWYENNGKQYEAKWKGSKWK